VFDNAFANAEGQVEAAKCGVTFFEAGDDAEGVEVVIEAEAVLFQGFVEGLFTGVAKRWMADVMHQGEGFRQRCVEAESSGRGAGDLGYFKGVCEAAAGVIALCSAACEDLGLAGQAAKGLGVEDAADIAHEC